MNAYILKRAVIIGTAAILFAVAPMISWGVTPPPEPSPPGEQPPDLIKLQQVANGKIAAIDEQKHTITIKGMVLDKTFDVPVDAVIVLKGNEHATLNDLKVGDEAKVSYQVEAGKLIAQRIEANETNVGELPIPPSSSPVS